MEALKLFSRHAPNKTFIAVILGALSGMAYALLIPIVMRALSVEGAGEEHLTEIFGFEVQHAGFAGLFVVLCAVIMLFKSLSEILLSRLSLDIQYELRKKLYRQIRRSPIAGIESVGEARLIQSLAIDVSAIVMGASLFPQLLTNGITLVGMLGYLAYLDFDVFVFVIQIIFVGVLLYQGPIHFGSRYFMKARDHKNTLQEAFRGLVGGAKELKLSQAKQNSFEQEILFAEEQTVIALEKRGQTIYSLANNFGGLMSFFAIGGLSFVFINYHNITNMQVIGAVMVLLYVSGPIVGILNFAPQMAMTKISLNKIEQLYQELPDEKVSPEVESMDGWQKLTFKDICYQYDTAGGREHSFGIGPVNLEINPGQVTFITGGNGSGKSTLAKVLSQHYRPTDGQILVDEQLIDEQNQTGLRDQICCIYSDYYLFDRPLGYGGDLTEFEQQMASYLTAFKLDGKVSLQNGKFSTLKLSDGQRRRLALIVAMVEDKALYLFDEWAADQDPEFKHVFYHQILEDLKQRGKAVVVISHDDRYFGLADQMVVMDSGKQRQSDDDSATADAATDAQLQEA